MAERLYVSEASLSRFAKKCGYRGYREFVYQYEETFVEKQESITGNTRMVLNAYQELLNKTYSLVDEAQIARICRFLSRANGYLCVEREAPDLRRVRWSFGLCALVWTLILSLIRI